MNFTKLKTCMEKLIEEYKVPGLDVIVNKNHEEVFRYTNGFSDIENKRKMEGNEIYDMFSMTKMITCASALTLAEKGAISLDDEISKYLPEFKKMKIAEFDFDASEGQKIASGGGLGENAEKDYDGFVKTPITIKHLFTMTAGFDYGVGLLHEKSEEENGPQTTREIVSVIADTVLGFEPGTRFRYSLCHDVLGAVIEVVSGKTLGEYMKENTFEPLGMENTSFDLPENERVMVKYRNENGMIKKIDQGNWFRVTEKYQSGGASLVSTASDYALFLDALASGGIGKNGNRILKESTIKLMGTNHLSGKALDDFDKMRKGYGYGLGVRVHINDKTSGMLSPLGEFGWDGAAGAFSLVDTKNKLSLTYFQQMSGWDLKTQQLITNALYSCFDKEDL